MMPTSSKRAREIVIMSPEHASIVLGDRAASRTIIYTTAIILVCLGACSRSQTPEAAIAISCPESTGSPHSFDLQCLEIEHADEVIGKWSFSSHWMGHMGIALEIRADGSFSYWFDSDVKSSNDPDYPIEGTWQLVKGTLRLSSIQESHLYATDWILVRYADSTGLLSPDNLKVLIWHEATPDTRMLFRNDSPFTWPMLNMPMVINESDS